MTLPARVDGPQPDDEPEIGAIIYEPEEPEPMIAPGDSVSENSSEMPDPFTGAHALGYRESIDERTQLVQQGFRQNETPHRTQLRIALQQRGDKVRRLTECDHRTDRQQRNLCKVTVKEH